MAFEAKTSDQTGWAHHLQWEGMELNKKNDAKLTFIVRWIMYLVFMPPAIIMIINGALSNNPKLAELLIHVVGFVVIVNVAGIALGIIDLLIDNKKSQTPPPPPGGGNTPE